MKKRLLILASLSFLAACDNTPTVEEFIKDKNLREEAKEICKNEPHSWAGFEKDSKYYQYCTNLAKALSKCMWNGCKDGKAETVDDYKGYTKQPPMNQLPRIK